MRSALLIEPVTLGLFAGAVLLLLMSPGPNMAFVVVHGVRYGWRGGVAAAVGIGLADLVLTAVTAAGITAVVTQWPPAFDLIRIAGVVYLLHMAWTAWRRTTFAASQDAPRTALSGVAMQAMLNSLLNPKALLFFMVFLPQFVQPSKAGVAEQIVVLGLVLTVIATVFHALLGALAGSIHRLMVGNASAVRWQSRGLSVVLLLLAIRLVFLQRPLGL